MCLSDIVSVFSLYYPHHPVWVWTARKPGIGSTEWELPQWHSGIAGSGSLHRCNFTRPKHPTPPQSSHVGQNAYTRECTNMWPRIHQTHLHTINRLIIWFSLFPLIIHHAPLTYDIVLKTLSSKKGFWSQIEENILYGKPQTALFSKTVCNATAIVFYLFYHETVLIYNVYIENINGRGLCVTTLLIKWKKNRSS